MERGCTKYKVWFAKDIGEIEVERSLMKRPGSEMSMAHEKHNCEICERKIEGEYAFLQHYDVLSHERIPLDSLNKKLRCIRLIWYRHSK